MGSSTLKAWFGLEGTAHDIGFSHSTSGTLCLTLDSRDGYPTGLNFHSLVTLAMRTLKS